MNDNNENTKLNSERYARMRKAVAEVISQTRWEYYDAGALVTDEKTRALLSEGLAERITERLVLDEGFDKIEQTLHEITNVIQRAMLPDDKQSDYAKQA